MEDFDLSGFEEAWNAPLTLPAGYQRPAEPEPLGFEEAWNAPLTSQPARLNVNPDCVYCQIGMVA